MIGAILLSSPSEDKRRGLFTCLSSHLGTTLGGSDTLVSSIAAIDERGYRSKVSSIYGKTESITNSFLDPYRLAFLNRTLPEDPYSIRLTNDPKFYSSPTPDVFAMGEFSAVPLISRGSCLYSAASGNAFSDSAVRHDDYELGKFLATLFVGMSLKDTDSLNFVSKIHQSMLVPVSGKFVSQLVSIGPDPTLVLAASRKKLHFYWVGYLGSFYLVWCDSPLVIPDREFYSLELQVSNNEKHITAFSIKMLRTRWVRWLTPKPSSSSNQPNESMRLVKSINALQEWLSKHSK